MSDSIIIGVDHGYAAMKTAHFAFPSGLVAYEYEPYTLSNVLEYGGKFYVVGSGRQPLQKDKTQAEDYREYRASCGASFSVSRRKLHDRECCVTSFRQGSYTPLRRLCGYPLWTCRPQTA